MPSTKYRYFIAKVVGVDSIWPPSLKLIMLQVYNTVQPN